MIDREDIDHNLFILRLIIRRKFGVEGESLDQAMSQMKRKLPKRAHRSAERIVEMSQRIGTNGTHNIDEISEFENLMSGLIDDLVYYDPEETRRRKMTGGRWEALFQLGVASGLMLLFMQWQGLI
ncbi:MAG: hypothetical protein ACU0A2_09345 [Cognatishimia sp.]|uniref:hypothetical protein n=1 Tax=Cognatishimia sp. TaxID=2211648 RepID=UPI004057D4DE